MNRKNFLIIVLLAVFLLIGANYRAPFLSLTFKKGKEINFTVKKGETAKEIIGRLKKEGMIKSKLFFELYVYFKKLENKFRAGEYKLRFGTGVRELAKILTSGGGLAETEITIIEGWGIKDIGLYLEKEGLMAKNDFLAAAKNIGPQWLEKHDFLKDKPSEADLEGYLFPDTYRIFKDEDAVQIIKKMLDNFNRKLDIGLKEEIKKQGKSIFEILTMASLIEKESREDKDRKIVADIFYKRLKAGQPLESCATINYILGKNKRRLSFEDTRIKSSYNTYLNLGLPPGPICNPSLSAIKAAVYPQETDYWYFLSPDDGSIIYSKTFEEHNKNKAKYFK